MSGGELAVKTGTDGELMMANFLKSVGWTSLSKNQFFRCSEGNRHKASKGKEDRKTHNIDGIYSYDNYLNHEEKDVVFCSSKHNLEKYSSESKIFEYLEDLAISLECAPRDYHFNAKFEDQKRKTTYKGLLFWVSSNQDEQNFSMANLVSEKILDNEGQSKSKIRSKDFNSVYLVDNAKANFIISAINTAKQLYTNCNIKFLYPHTGRNNETEEVMVAGEVMPIQYINTSLLPIVVDGTTNATLFFCDESYDSASLRRIIWFAHKACGLSNAIRIFFKDYDKTRHESEVDIVKQSFKDNSLTSKIKVSRTNKFDLLTLKESSDETNHLEQPVYTGSITKISTSVSNAIEDSLDRMLPFGEMMRPIIDSTVLTDRDIKSFLVRKGIYLGNGIKSETVPLLSTLLLSPGELETLRSLLRTKEDRIKAVPRHARLINGDTSVGDLRQIIAGCRDVNLPAHCTMFEAPEIIEVDKDRIRVPFKIQRQNSTKDLITGKQVFDGELDFRIQDGELRVQLNYTSRDTYKVSASMFHRVERELVNQNFIASDGFFSIKFNVFNDNTDRINYLLSFINPGEPSFFSDGQLEYISVRPDNSIEDQLPFDLESLKERVTEINIGGRELDSMHYFNPEYKRALLMDNIRIKYNFHFAGRSGICVVDLGFENGLSNPEGEFRCNVEITKRRSSSIGINTESARRALLERINWVARRKYDSRSGASQN